LKLFNPSNGVEERDMLFLPPIASLHWGLFKLKACGLPTSSEALAESVYLVFKKTGSVKSRIESIGTGNEQS
jgi:hypothetical protein